MQRCKLSSEQLDDNYSQWKFFAQLFHYFENPFQKAWPESTERCELWCLEYVLWDSGTWQSLWCLELVFWDPV